MRQMISEHQKQEAIPASGAAGRDDEDTVQGPVNPVDVLQHEFNGSGIAVAKELTRLRARAAAAELREQRFDRDALLAREPCDDQSLRALVVGLQNELYYSRQTIEQLERLGCEVVNEGAPEEQESAQPQKTYSEADVAKMADVALQNVDRDLLPQDMANVIDQLVSQAVSLREEQAQLTQSGPGQVSRVQALIEKRLAVTQALAEQTDGLLRFVKAREEDPDLDSEMMQFLRDQGLTLARAGK